MPDEQQTSGQEDHRLEALPEEKRTLELCFILFCGLAVLAALIESLTYDFVAARAPLVVIVPLLILIVLQIRRAWAAARDVDVGADLRSALRGRNKEFNNVGGLLGWMVVLLVLIYVAGHYAGIAAFMFILLYMVSEEDLVLSISVPVIVTLVTYALFEYLFNIELYRGLIYRIWAGYGVF